MKKLLAMLFAAVLALWQMPAGAQSVRVAQLLAEMPLRDKLTQMMMVDFMYWDEELPLTEEGKPDKTKQTPFTVMNPEVEKIIRDYNFGAVIYFAQNLTGTQQAYELTLAMQRAAVSDGGIPMLIAADQEGGSVYRLASGTSLPGNMALSAAGKTEYARAVGRIIGSELNALGINTNLAPVMDVNNNAANPVIGLRSFGDDPATVGEFAAAVIDGMKEQQVIGCAKHFPGHGDTQTDSHYGLASVDKELETLLACELAPFRTAIAQGVEMIMTAHILYPQLEKDRAVSLKTGQEEALPATMSDDIIIGLLKNEMGFEGVVITDAMNMGSITAIWSAEQAAVLAIEAGADMLCIPWCLHSPGEMKKLDAIIESLCTAVEQGQISMARIDDAVTRILTLKESRGILDWAEDNNSLENALAVVGCQEHRQAEREISAAAVTVVRNKNHTLPLKISENSKVLMLTPYKNEMGQMVMGWNRTREAGLIPDGAQVRVECFYKMTEPEELLEAIRWADTLIFNSEIDTASGMNGGSWASQFILAAIDAAQAEGKTTVVQSVDKPYDVQSYPQADAVVAIYGCKGSTVDPTEALMGSVTASEAASGPNIVAGIEVMLGVYGAQGRLPVDVPLFEAGAFTDQTAFERGFGLFYEGLK